jgi:hypothetical protein
LSSRAVITAMRTIYLCLAILSLAATALVWAFLAGWAGGVVFAPDRELLATGESLSWPAFMALMYGPIAFAACLLFLAWRKSP